MDQQPDDEQERLHDQEREPDDEDYEIGGHSDLDGVDGRSGRAAASEASGPVKTRRVIQEEFGQPVVERGQRVQPPRLVRVRRPCGVFLVGLGERLVLCGVEPRGFGVEGALVHRGSRRYPSARQRHRCIRPFVAYRGVASTGDHTGELVTARADDQIVRAAPWPRDR
jgi:hypothetical protein